ncbi:MAG: uridine kinase [Candidatus Krumholzibacteriota bacterium]|nr:uridine kinase [Candidatus Krumholzibacteriota bacterium]
MKEMPYMLGITGASCSGKSSLARALVERLTGFNSLIIQTDSYYRDLGEMPPEERNRYNFDDPAALDFELIFSQLEGLREGREVAVPSYSFSTHQRAPEEEWSPLKISRSGGRRPLIVIEGLHAFHEPRIRDLLDMKVFIDASLRLCLSRRIERDVRERGRTKESVVRQFEEMVVPMFDRYVLPTRKLADIIINGGDSPNRLVEKIIPRINLSDPNR